MPSVDDVVKPFYLDLTEDEIAQAQATLGDILRSGRLMLGPNTEQLESEFAKMVGVKDAVAVSTGTAALEVLLHIHGARGKRIAVPTNTNFATVAAVLHTGGTPAYLDMSPDTFMPTLAMVQEAHAEQALDGVVWVHIGGVIPPDFGEITAWCKREGIFLIEDAAHAHGSRLKGTNAGAFADGGAFSFFPTKVMTSMEGGMVTTNDDEVALLARSYRNQGKRGATFGNDHRDLGNSWRINELGAVIGCIQLAKLDAMLERRQAAATSMAATLDDASIPYVSTAHMDRAANYKLIVRTEAPHDQLKPRFAERGIVLGGGVYERPCHLQPVFEHVATPARGLPNAERYCPNHICPPLTSGMSASDVERVNQALRECLVPA